MGLFDRILNARTQVANLLDSAKLNSVIERHERELMNEPRNLAALQELSLLYQERGEPHKACEAMCRSAAVYLDRQDFEQALLCYRKAERIASGEMRLDVWRKLFDINYRLRRYEEAFGRARQIVEHLMELGDSARAVDFVNAMPELGQKDILYRREIKLLVGLEADNIATVGSVSGTWQRKQATVRDPDEYFPELTILIVDDEPGILNVLETSLRALGCQILTAANGRIACDLIKAHQPAIIISDLNMPEMDGSQLFEWLRSQPDHMHVPFVCLSSADSEAERMAAFDMGVEDYWSKPFRPMEVRHRVKRLLKRVRPPVDLQGKLSQVSLPEVVQMLETGRRTGLLLLTHQSEEAKLYFRDGSILDVEYGAARAERAFFRLVGWTTGNFTFRSVAVNREPVMSLNPQQLLMEAFRRFDEVEHIIAELPARDQTFICGDAFDRAPEVADQIAQEGEFAANIERVRQLFDGSRTLDQCCDELRDDLETLLLVQELIAQKLLVPGQVIEL
ncbi:MAG: response regulator [Chloracidobacterium sp.]|uniref:Response regulator n=1 Tax=Chloracidobacterium validum TaxID=2821543 RepID=A0ABX8B8M1_9BACT|nr:response regulator [Chloracidobacterium validum]QUW01948.1 response regulator [Chloracidobacterium validum]